MLQIARIFTGTSISQSIYLRQRSDRYIIHAGQNLLDNEFRYIRTLRVRAAVNWCLCLLRKQLTFALQHWADVRPYTCFFKFAKSCVFSKQSPLLILCYILLKNFNRMLPFSRSYRNNLPNSLNIFLSYT